MLKSWQRYLMVVIAVVAAHMGSAEAQAAQVAYVPASDCGFVCKLCVNVCDGGYTMCVVHTQEVEACQIGWNNCLGSCDGFWPE